MGKKIVVTKGDKYGRLEVLEEILPTSFRRGTRGILCKCNCGSVIKVALDHLKSGHSKSCGCLITDVLIKRNKTHGTFLSEEIGAMKQYYAWQGILKRCYNKNEKGFKNYGGRGIVVCDRWKDSFENFRDDTSEGFEEHIEKYGSKNTLLDRINNDGNYEPGNVRWTTRDIQNRNRRSIKEITWNGETKNVTEWAKFFKIPKITLWQRLYKQKLGVEEAFKRSLKT